MTGHRLMLLRVHQRDSAIDARERIAERAAHAAGPDLVVFATCHRVECFGVTEGTDETAKAWLAGRLGLDETAEDLGRARWDFDEAAAHHLMRVACGLDSVVQGEGQVVTQLRRAFDDTRAAGPLDPLLAELFPTALHLARSVRSSTALGQVRRSIGSLAVESGLALLAEPKRATALIIGAGEVGKLAARALAARVGTLVIANRDIDRAHPVAAMAGARVVGLDELDAELDRADLVISAADTRGTVLTSARLAHRLAARPLVLIDIAVPRSVAEADRHRPGLEYRSVDDVSDAVSSLDPETLREAARRCAEAAARFAAGRRGRSAAGTIAAIREQAEQLRRRQLDRALAKLAHLSERDRQIIDALSSGLTNELLHAPTVALKEKPEDAPLARRLFGLGGDDAE